MDQTHHSISSRPLQRYDGGGSSSDRHGDRRAAVAQNMAENREGLGMKVIAVMVQHYGVLPRELWDLNSISDMGAGRGITYNDDVPEAIFKSILGNARYSILNLTISRNKHKVVLPLSLRRLSIHEQKYRYPLDLPDDLEELVFSEDCLYNRPLVLPKRLHKLVLGKFYSQPLTLPPELIELELGSEYRQPLVLPPRLKRLAFHVHSRFNIPMSLPQSLVSISFNDSYNQPTFLPPHVEVLRVGWCFTHDLSFPTSLRKIVWCCNRRIQIPESVSEVSFRGFNKPVVLPLNLKKVSFVGTDYSHPLVFPTELEELEWFPKYQDQGGLVLPESLQKLTWGSKSNVTLPLGLRELVIKQDASLVLPEGLLKVTFDCWSSRNYELPESVQEVTLAQAASITHPTTLQHLKIHHALSCWDLTLSSNSISKLTIGDRGARIQQWPRGLKELAFTVDDMEYPLRVPKGCEIVGEKLPTNVIME